MIIIVIKVKTLDLEFGLPKENTNDCITKVFIFEKDRKPSLNPPFTAR